MFVVQHPYEVDTFHQDDPSSWASLTATNVEGKLWPSLPILYLYILHIYLCILHLSRAPVIQL